MPVTVGVAGITGKFARLVVKNLLAVPDVNVRGLCRNSSKLPKHLRSSPRVAIVPGEATDTDALRRFANGCDVVVCCYLGDNTLMTEGQKLLVDACECENVPRYIASDYTFDFTKLEYGQHPAKDPMKHVKEYLETKKIVQGVHVLVGAFMETFWRDEIFESTTYGTSAAYVASVALDRNAVGMLHFLGDRKSIRELAGEFAEVYGKEATLERKGSLDDLYNNMQAAYKKDPSNIISYLQLFYQYYCSTGQTYLGDLDNDKYPSVKPVSFKEFMKSVKLEDLGIAYTFLETDA